MSRAELWEKVDVAAQQTADIQAKVNQRVERMGDGL
jgi:hypothetical protein